MSLIPGSRLGPYEILAPIGAGGMGEVYRARDPRLGRDVAIKVLPASFSADADRLRRFEQEAKAAGVLNHPNVTAVYDIGQHDGAPYVVQELLEGETLRSVLAGGKLSPRRTIDYSLQIVHGLAAAHGKGIVHRDLKPENIFVTHDGRVKILDFGLAKLTHTEEKGGVTSLPTATQGTEPGVVLGTLGYMSPEQVRGRPADPRSDIFAFGAILYEMLAGRRAFFGASPADTMSAILKEDPPDLSATNQTVSPGLDRIVRHCLEKNPDQRFHSAHDLAFDLEALSGVSGTAGTAAPARKGRRRALLLAAAAAAAIVLLFAAYRVGRQARPESGSSGGAEQVSRTRLTFRRGNVLFARFTTDGQSVVYGAAWGDRPAEIFQTHVGSPETRPLGFPKASLLSVSPSGELAILQKESGLFGVYGGGTLARAPMAGGAARQIEDDVLAADWTPDGNNLAIIRDMGTRAALEFPQGKPVYSTASLLSSVRVSPDGKRVAVVETLGSHSSIKVIEPGAKPKEFAKDFLYIDTLAWPPSGREIWFDGMDSHAQRGIYAAGLDGGVRMVAASTDAEVLQDIARDGSVLIEREIPSQEILGSFPGESRERPLSWLEQSFVATLSDDGKKLLFSETGEGGGKKGSVYLRATDGSPAVRLGDGQALDLSPDGKWALTLLPSPAPRLVLLPTGVGEPKPIPFGTLQVIFGLFLPPDGERLVLVATEPGQGIRGYLMDRKGGQPRAITPDLSNGGAVSPDGKFVAVNLVDRRAVIIPVAGGAPRLVPSVEPDDVPNQWSADGEYLYLFHQGAVPLPIYRVHLKTGKKELWKELIPADRTGVVGISGVSITRDGLSYVYSCNRVIASDLFLVKGWR